MSKPGVFNLTKLALDFFLEHKDVFWRRMMVILPVAIILIAITQYGAMNKMAWVKMATLIPIILVQGLFSLSWHRLSMQGRDSDYKVNPIWPMGNDWKFIRMFLSITLIPAIPPVLFMLFILFHVYNGQAVDARPYVPYIYLASGVLLLAVIQYVFLLPASAGGLDLKLAQARRAAKGMRLRLLGGFLIYLLLLIIVFYLYSAMLGIVFMSLGNVQVQGLAAIATTTFLAIPVFIAMMAFIALVSTMICRAYEWGMANNKV